MLLYAGKLASRGWRIVLVILIVLAGCQSDETEAENGLAIDLSKARLMDFPLSETSYLDIAITHPVISGGVQATPGDITITVPHAQQSLMLSLKQFDLDNFNISPSPGVLQDFSAGPVTYTISSHSDPAKSVQYRIKVVHGGDPFFQNALITGFKFETTKNPALPATVEAVKIIEYANYHEVAIYVIVPAGTDFSNLVPTVSFDAAKLYYNTSGDYKLYADQSIAFNLKYPKSLMLQAENSAGVKSKAYRVIVDVKDPIRFEDSKVVTANVNTGTGSGSEYFPDVARWTNQGNHPVTGLTAVSYKDRGFPATGFPNDFNVITATLSNPVGGTLGVMPGESGYINVRVSRIAVPGLFSTTAVFQPTFSHNTQLISYWPVADRIEPIFDPVMLTVESTLVE